MRYEDKIKIDSRNALMLVLLDFSGSKNNDIKPLYQQETYEGFTDF